MVVGGSQRDGRNSGGISVDRKERRQVCSPRRLSLGMCYSEFAYCGRCCPILLFIAREAVPTYIQGFPGTKRTGLGFAASPPGQGPFFSALLHTWETQPCYLAGVGHACPHVLFATISPCSMPESPVPARSKMGPKCKMGSRVAAFKLPLSTVLPWAKQTPAPQQDGLGGA